MEICFGRGRVGLLHVRRKVQHHKDQNKPLWVYMELHSECVRLKVSLRLSVNESLDTRASACKHIRKNRRDDKHAFSCSKHSCECLLTAGAALFTLDSRVVQYIVYFAAHSTASHVDINLPFQYHDGGFILVESKCPPVHSLITFSSSATPEATAVRLLFFSGRLYQYFDRCVVLSP